MRNGYRIIAVALALLPIWTSCRQDLCYDHYPFIDMSLEWEMEWERDYGEYHLGTWDAGYHGKAYHDLRPGTPEWVNMVRFYEDGEHADHFVSPQGEKFRADGKREYSMLLYNGDTEYIILSDVASLNDARASATTRTRSLFSNTLIERHPDTRTTNPPDVLFSAYVDNMPKVNIHEVRQMPVKMQPLVYTYVVTFEFEHGGEHVALARGALAGMAESVYLRTGVTSEESSIILFDCNITPQGCRAEVRSFGVPGFPDKYYGRTTSDPDDRLYTLNLEVKLQNGKIIEFNHDISEQLKKQPRGGIIEVKGLRIEDEASQITSGFVVDVSDWGNNTEIIDLPIGNQ